MTVGALYYLRGRQWLWRNEIDPNFSFVITSALAHLSVTVRGHRLVFHNLHFCATASSESMLNTPFSPRAFFTLL
jgi:hypothetical protein